jgi:hypothetical protein
MLSVAPHLLDIDARGTLEDLRKTISGPSCRLDKPAALPERWPYFLLEVLAADWLKDCPSEPTSRLQDLPGPLGPVWEGKGDDLIVSREFDLAIESMGKHV